MSWRPREHFKVLIGVVVIGSLGFIVRMLVRHKQRDRFEPPGELDPKKTPRPVIQRIPADIYRRPDPMIYAQFHLMDQGIAVTWNNPDIQLEKNGVPVASNQLEVVTAYEIVVRVWNGSTHAPAVGLPVRLSFLTFGIGTKRTAIGTDHVNLAVKGTPGAPAFARIPWTTPATAGHYCLQAELLWPDDANPHNNLGQENTKVKALNSPRAGFEFPVRNDGTRRRSLRLEVDGYALGEPTPCPPARKPGDPPPSERERAERRRRARARHHHGAHPIPPGWSVKVAPAELTLDPGEQTEVKVEILAPDGFEGSKAFNVNAFAGERLVGGVTLVAEGKA